MKVIIFLIKYELFKDNFIYTSIRAYTLKNQVRYIYNELHIKN